MVAQSSKKEPPRSALTLTMLTLGRLFFSQKQETRTTSAQVATTEAFVVTMVALAALIVSRQNEPLFYYGGAGEEAQAFPSAESLGKQMAVHCALDIVEERRRKAAGSAPSSADLYFGQLLQVDDYKVFGHYSNTHIKTLVVCDSATDAMDVSVRELVLNLRTMYAAVAQNPFQAPEKPVTSVRFRKTVGQLLSAHNVKAHR